MEPMQQLDFSESSGPVGAFGVTRLWTPASHDGIFICWRESLEPLVSARLWYQRHTMASCMPA